MTAKTLTCPVCRGTLGERIPDGVLIQRKGIPIVVRYAGLLEIACHHRDCPGMLAVAVDPYRRVHYAVAEGLTATQAR